MLRPRALHRPGSTLWRRIVAHRWHYAFLAPMVVLYLGFTAWPMVASWIYSLFDWNGTEPLTDFVGVDNFRQVISDPRFWRALWHSLEFSLAAIFIEIPLAIMFASLLNQTWLRGRNLYRLLLFLPVVSTTAVVGIVFVILLNTSRGPVNEALSAIGIGPVNFLGDSSTALPSVIAVDIWKGFGVSLVYWLAALQSVPKDLLEAAEVDGARAWQRLRHITLPLLVPIGVVIVLLTFDRSLNPFDVVQAMTQGGPGYATEVEATYVYRFAFNSDFAEPRFGFASAAGAVFGLAVLFITVAAAPALRRARRSQRENQQAQQGEKAAS